MRSLMHARMNACICGELCIFLIYASIHPSICTKDFTSSLSLCRVYIEDTKLTDAAKTHLSGATRLSYNVSEFIKGIESEGSKSSAKIWVNFCFLFFAQITS